MPEIYESSQPATIIIYFIYGLAIFMMGFAIALQNSRLSSLRLARSFYYLAVFGIIHGLADWGHVFIPIMSMYASQKTLAVLYLIEVILTGISFVFLLYFGLRLLVDTLEAPRFVLWLPRVGALAWFSVFILFPHFPGQNDIQHWYLLGNIFSRYFFALPGAVLSAAAIWHQQEDLSRLGRPEILRHLRLTSAMFVLYALFAGLIVPPASFPPASWLNTENLFLLTGIPVAVFRASVCTVIAYYVIRLTAVFDYENRKQLLEAEQDYAVLLDRQRIRRDLHDGIMQSIYAVGLGLETARRLAATAPDKVEAIIAREAGRLDLINNEIRQYIMDMQQSTFSDRSLKEVLLGMVEEFKVRTGLPVELSIADAHLECLDAEQKEHICLIMQELLSNIHRHSSAAKASVSLRFSPGGLEIVVCDDGKGFDKNKTRSGLQNVLERAEQLNATLEIHSGTGLGTKINLMVPCH